MSRKRSYLDDHPWNAVDARKPGRRDEQMKAMQEFVGIRKGRSAVRARRVG